MHLTILASHALVLSSSPLAPRWRAAAARMEFGDFWYAGFEEWASAYPQEDKEQ